MTAMVAYRRLAMQALASVTLLLLPTLMITPAHALDTITVALDQATIAKVPESATTLVVGNPLIADVTVRPGGLLVVTGKSYGVTNLIALDASGAVLSEHYIEVGAPHDEVVFVWRGVDRESYSCTPGCEPRITLGDAPAFFNKTLKEGSDRSAQAVGQAPGN